MFNHAGDGHFSFSILMLLTFGSRLYMLIYNFDNIIEIH